MLRLCVVGSGGVGKSCVTLRYLKNEFNEYYDPTMEETYETEVNYRGKLFPIEIVDTAGQEEFASFLDSSLSTGDAFMILYAINSSTSWDELIGLRNKIFTGKECKTSPHVPIILVGNKVDLDHEREVESDKAQEFADTIRVPYIETSAKTGFNVTNAFNTMIEEIERTRPDLLQKHLTLKKPNQNKEQRRKDCQII